LDELAKAAEHYQEVLALAQAAGAPSLLYRAQHGLGQVAVKQGRLPDAREHLGQAVETVERLRQGLRVEEFRLGFLEDKLQVYHDAVLLCLEMGRDEEAFGYVERAKSGALVDLLIASLSHPPEDEDAPDGHMLARLNALREQLNWHHSKLRGNGASERGERAHIRETDVWQRISAIEEQMVHAWRKLQKSAPFYVALPPPGVSTPDALRACLRPGEVLLQYYVAGETILAFVADREGLRACLPLNSTITELDNTVGALNATLPLAPSCDDGDGAGHRGLLSQQRLGTLYDDLLRPLLPYLEGAEHLVMAPDDILFEIPFHALHDGERYLLERFEISYTPSAGALRLCQENLRRRGAVSGQSMVVGYSSGERLPYVHQEVESVRRALPGALVLTGERAGLAPLQTYAGQSSLLHLATHAVFRHDNPLFSALQLAGGDWLRLMDLYNLQLNGTLVTLSACETGRHRLLGGDLLGLSRGFFYAGAAALVVSLWPVNDVSAAMLMERFYAHLVAGEPAARALRQAQSELLNSKEQGDGAPAQPYDHPFYWAPFCLLGAPDVRLT
jgi:hypothetical protein